MASSYKLGCLGKPIVLWFVFFSWFKYAHLHFFNPCEAEPSMPEHALCTGTTYSSTQKQCPITVVRNSSTSSHYWEHLGGQHNAWHAWSFTDKFLCGHKAPVSGCMTDDLQTYTLAHEQRLCRNMHICTLYVMHISSFMLNAETDRLPCLPKIVLIHEYGTYIF